MERLAHELPGSNIIMSEAFLAQLSDKPANVTKIGVIELKGQSQPITVYALLSDFVKAEQLIAFQSAHCLPLEEKKAG